MQRTVQTTCGNRLEGRQKCSENQKGNKFCMSYGFTRRWALFSGPPSAACGYVDPNSIIRYTESSIMMLETTAAELFAAYRTVVGPFRLGPRKAEILFRGRIFIDFFSRCPLVALRDGIERCLSLQSD